MDENTKEMIDKMADMHVEIESLLIDVENAIDLCNEEN